jgi:hypothetical protein
MYLTDILNAEDIKGNGLDVPVDFIREQVQRMQPLLKMCCALEDAHRETLPGIYFAPGFLMYLDYIIHKNTSGTVQ